MPLHLVKAVCRRRFNQDGVWGVVVDCDTDTPARGSARALARTAGEGFHEFKVAQPTSCHELKRTSKPTSRALLLRLLRLLRRNGLA